MPQPACACMLPEQQASLRPLGPALSRFLNLTTFPAAGVTWSEFLPREEVASLAWGAVLGAVHACSDGLGGRWQ